MYRKILPVALLITMYFNLPCVAQSLQLLKKIKINTPTSVSLDRYNHIFIGDSKGNIHKFDSVGTLLLNYSSPNTAAVTSLEAWSTLQIFAFYRDSQTFTIFNRFLAPMPGTPIQFNTQQIGFAKIAAPATDENVWIFDETDFSLKKYNVQQQHISVHTPLALTLNESEYLINFMREYQNMLFINDYKSGILVFDNLGNYKNRLPFPQLHFFGFYKDDLYFLKDNKIYLYNLYTASQKTLDIPAGEKIKYVLLFSNTIILLSEANLLICKRT